MIKPVQTKKPILLSLIGQELINNDKIKVKVKKSPLILKTKNILATYPQLTGLPSDLTLFKAYRNKYGTLAYLTLCVYQDEDKPVIVSPSLNADIIEGFQIESFKIDNQGTATISYQDISLIVPMALTDTAQSMRFHDELTTIEGTLEDIDPIWLKDIPKLEIPLKNLPIGVPFTIITTGKKSKKYETPLIDIQDDNGNQYLNVITNSFLSLYAQNNGQRFEITEISEEKRKIETGKKKDGSPKTETRLFTKVNIKPLDGSQNELNLANL